MIKIIYDGTEINIANLEPFILYSDTNKLERFVKDFVGTANNKDELKDILTKELDGLIYYYQTKKQDKTNMTESECQQWIRKAEGLLKELEKI